MAQGNIVYRPPETDSEDEYDGFCFGDDFIKKERRSFWVADVDQDLYDAATSGDLDKIKQQVEMLKFDVNSPIKGGFTLLLHACREGYWPIVQWLLEEKKANPNYQVESMTPLMFACDCTQREPYIIEKIVLLLLKHGAVLNVSDKYGSTPFMHVCKNGFINVARHMINDVSFDAVDNQGCTPIFHAIENNHPEIVKLLVEAGVNSGMANNKGYTPLQVAQFHGFYDLLDILPKEPESYMVPSQFLGYNSLRDQIPQIFLKTECPEYFQDINSILLQIGMQRFLQYFAKEHISLGQFLCMTDAELEAVGIEYPIYRMKIRKGLLDFHLHQWSKKSIARVSKSSKDDFYGILMIAANHLQHFVIIRSSLRYIKNNLKSQVLGPLRISNGISHHINDYQTTIKDLRKTVKYLASFSPPKPPVFIDYDEFLAERKRDKLKCYFKYTTLFIGISAVLCLKMVHFF